MKPYSPAKYRVILLSNGNYKKTLYRCNTLQSAYVHFHKFKNDNEKIIYPQKFINTQGIKPVKYQICLTKITEDDDTTRVLRDDLGKLYNEEFLPDWTILNSSDYNIEETFWLYGYNPKKERPDISEIIRRLMLNAYAKKTVKQVIVVHNKLLIYSEDQFDMVVCKNILDAQRLHHTLAKLVKKEKLKSLLFMGTSSKANIGRYYDVIHLNTGWPYSKIRRTSTRP